MNRNLYELLLGKKVGGEVCALEIDSGRRLSYDELDELTSRTAGSLVEAGLKRFDRVAVCLDKSPEAIVACLAVIKAGAIFVPLNTALTLPEIEFLLKEVEPNILIANSTNAIRLKDLSRSLGFRILRLDEGGLTDNDSLGLSDRPLYHSVQMGEQDPAAILFTSGTTGTPKGAVISHGNLNWCTETYVKEWGFEQEDVVVHALPLFHAHGLFLATFIPLACRAQVVLHKKFEADAVIERFRSATVFMGVPTLYKRLMLSSKLNVESCQHMRLFISGSAPLSEADFTEFRRRTGHNILERYGMTETLIISSNPLSGERLPGSVGFASPSVELRVVKDEKQSEHEEMGVLEVRGPNLFTGYWRQPEKTREEFSDDGYFTTGDLARIDSEGRVWLAGRVKDLIISGGYNIYAREVETVLDEVDGVLQSAVLGIPHPDYGEGVIAVLKLRNGANTTEDQIICHARRKLASYKIPKKILFQDELPTTKVGKVQKHILAEKYASTFNASSQER